MDLRGSFTLDQEEHYLGDPIEVTLRIHNETDKDVYLFVPRGRAGGIRVAVKEGKNVQFVDMSEEPEPGLIPELRLPPGETHRQRYVLTPWLLFKEPGQYTVECVVPIEFYDVSLRQMGVQGVQRIGTSVELSADLRFTIQARRRQPTERER